MTYLQYHLIFILPPLLLLAGLTWRAARRGPVAGLYQPNTRWVWGWYALFPLIPVLYTTLWDNYLVARGVWTYPPDRVLARLGYVPVEEYAFFVLQTLITGLWLLAWLRRAPEARALSAPARWGGAGAWLLLSFVGVLCLRAEPTFYLGLILAWACPVLAGLWAFGGDLIAARPRTFWGAVLPPTVYLWATDLIAIRAGIWSISPRFTSGLNVFGLPLEEMLFFFITNLLVVTGLLLFWHPEAFARIRRGLRVVRPWMVGVGLYALLKIPVPLWPEGFPLLATLSTVFLALGALAWAWERVGARSLTLAALALLVGLGVEVLGSRTGFPFGPYRYSPPGLTVLGVPLLVPLGWFAMTLASGVLARGRAWLAGLLLVAWDLGLEPLMTAQGFWTWGGRLPRLDGVTVEAWARPAVPAFGAIWAGAPIQNFVAWFVVGAGLVWLFGRLAPELFGLKRRDEEAVRRSPRRPPTLTERLGPVPDLRLAYLIECFFLPAGLLLLGQPLAALVTLLAMGGGVDLLAAAFRRLIRRSVRAGLAGVWLRGALPAGGAVLAPNHHSWWDGYLLGELAWSSGHPVALMMTARQLRAFPFFRRLGALDPTELRPALRRLRAGTWLVVFPEGELCPAGSPGPLRPGAAWLARAGGVPLVPVALRVALRGAQRPEAYLRVGPPVEGPELAAALTRELAALDRDLATSDPEAPLAGYLRLAGGRGSDSERFSRLSRWLARLTGDAR